MKNVTQLHTKVQIEDTIISVNFMSISGVAEILDDWDDLLGNAIEPNPCYSPAFSQEIFDQQKYKWNQGFITIWKNIGDAQEQKNLLIGLLPVSHLVGAPFRLFYFAQAQTSYFSGSGSPLLREDHETVAIGALFQWAKTHNVQIRLNEFRLETPVGELFELHIDAENLARQFHQQHERPAIIPQELEWDDYLSKIKGKTKQTLRRKRKQLSELGEVTYTNHNELSNDIVLDEFIALEDAGWKGEIGTSIAQDEKANRIVKNVIAQPKFPGARIDALRLDGRAIAMTLHIGTKHSALFLKSAFDESLSKYSPGLLIHLDTAEVLLKEKWASHLDSCVSNPRSVSSIWQENVTSCTMLVSGKNIEGNYSFRLIDGIFSTMRSIRAFAKKIRHLSKKTQV